MNLIPAEILQLVSDAKTKSEKIALLRKHESPILLQILKHTFEPRITYSVGLIESWKPDTSPVGINPSNLWQEFRKIKYFYNSPSNLTPQPNRKKVLKDILECIHETDAHVMLGVLKKELPYEIDANLVLSAFPGLWDTTHPANISKQDEKEMVTEGAELKEIADKLPETMVCPLDDIDELEVGTFADCEDLEQLTNDVDLMKKILGPKDDAINKDVKPVKVKKEPKPKKAPKAKKEPKPKKSK